MPKSIFQTTVLKKRIDSQKKNIDEAYEVYRTYFLDETIHEIIRNHKEEEYKPEFLRKLFVEVLGYTPSFDSLDDFNLRVEQKNEDGQRKADASILVKGEVRGVIEIKDTRTIDLGRIQDQAFGYKNHHKNALYVITSNFEKLRFYIDYAGEYQEWDLFTLSREGFASLWTCLACENIKSNLPKRLKTESITREEEITKDFYAHYKQFKNDLYANLIEKNPDVDKLTLFMSAQKILDRVLFIRFAEDRGLLEPNIIALYVIKGWETICAELGNDYPLYDHLKRYFGYLDKGHTDDRRTIFGYNGGLFLPDTTLDNLKISDAVLRNHLWALCRYDFNSEVDVNILGHIFEHSLTEIEAVKNELVQPHERTSPKQGKRKKEGIFYTPNYITKYIIDQTLGQLCIAKKRELGINDEWLNEAIRTKKKKKKTLENALEDERLLPLNQYRDWLLSMTICDPACGSGAFLNAAYDFLREEHRSIDEMIGKIVEMRRAPVSVGIENEILRNNLYGVDLNEEGVEITRLALWFHTATPNTKLCFLDENIKCGNSLISDPSVAGSKAFDWHKEFPQVFEKGGFDVVIGNPPYYNVETLGFRNPQAWWIRDNYPDIWQKKSDILFYFIFKALELSKGEVGYIVSNAFLFSNRAQKLRNHILKDARLSRIVNFERYMVFPDASITTGIFVFNSNRDGTKATILKDKNYHVEDIVKTINNEDKFFAVDLKEDQVFALVPEAIYQLNKRIDGEHSKLEELCFVGSGMQTAANETFSFSEFPEQFPEKYVRKRLVGENVCRYFLDAPPDYLLYVENADNFEDLSVSVQKYLKKHETELSNRATVKNEGRVWWRYSRPVHRELYHLSKIWCSYRSKENAFVLDETGNYIGLTNTTVIFDTNSEYSLKYILALLNSRLLSFRYKSIGKQTGSGVFEYFAHGVGKLPIPAISISEQQPFIDLAERMLSFHIVLRDHRERFLETLSDHFDGFEIAGKLRQFDDLEFKHVLVELKKQKFKKLSLAKQYDWKQFFYMSKRQVIAIRKSILQTDVEIDRMVYALYGLTNEEIALVEKFEPQS